MPSDGLPLTLYALRDPRPTPLPGTIQMLGPQFIGIEAGTMWNDAGVCNSRKVVNGADRYATIPHHAAVL